MGRAERHIIWELDKANGVYERGEQVLAVVMLRCLRPLGVREASESTSLCPNMKQVRPPLMRACTLCFCTSGVLRKSAELRGFNYFLID